MPKQRGAPRRFKWTLITIKLLYMSHGKNAKTNTTYKFSKMIVDFWMGESQKVICSHSTAATTSCLYVPVLSNSRGNTKLQTKIIFSLQISGLRRDWRPFWTGGGPYLRIPSVHKIGRQTPSPSRELSTTLLNAKLEHMFQICYADLCGLRGRGQARGDRRQAYPQHTACHESASPLQNCM